MSARLAPQSAAASPLSYSQQISRFALRTAYADLPQDVVAAAKRHLLDVVGVGLAGARQRVAQYGRAGIAAVPGAAGDATVWGSSVRLAAPYAALANGIAAHVLDFDDTHTDSITHGSAVLGPVVIALGEHLGASGAEALAAFALGWEVTARVGLTARGSFHRRGFHTTSVAGVFGAAVAAGKLLGLDEAQMSHALGLAGSQVAGISEYLSNASSAKSFHPGWAAHSGIVAASLARAGMTGPMTVFEGRYGLLKTYGSAEESDPAQLAAALGSRWEVARISIKPYPCCHFAHAFVDCAIALRRDGIEPAGVAQIECVVPEIEVPLICEPYAEKLDPSSPYAAKFSLPYLVAVGMIEGGVGHATFAPAMIARRDLIALARRVGYRLARPGETPFPQYFPGLMHVTLKSGDIIEKRLDVNRGNPDNPLAAAEIEVKFRANAAGSIPDHQTEALLSGVLELERATVREWSRRLAAIQ